MPRAARFAAAAEVPASAAAAAAATDETAAKPGGAGPNRRASASSFYVDCREESRPLDAWDPTEKVCLDRRWLYDWQVFQSPADRVTGLVACRDPVYVHNTQTGEWDQCCLRFRPSRAGLFQKVVNAVKGKNQYWSCKPMEQLRHQYTFDGNGVGRPYFQCGDKDDCSAPSQVCLAERQRPDKAKKIMSAFGLGPRPVCLDVGERGLYGSEGGVFGDKDREVYYFADPWPLPPPAPARARGGSVWRRRRCARHASLCWHAADEPRPAGCSLGARFL